MRAAASAWSVPPLQWIAARRSTPTASATRSKGAFSNSVRSSLSRWEDFCPQPLIERKAGLAALLADTGSPLHYCDHQIGHGRAFHEKGLRDVARGDRLEARRC